MPTILVIDDDSQIRQLLATILQKEGYEVILAENGRAGLQSLQSHRPAVVISDIFMPEKEGIETIREIVQTSPRTRIVAISGGGRCGLDFLDWAEAFGASAVVRKPFRREEILNAIRGPS